MSNNRKEQGFLLVEIRIASMVLNSLDPPASASQGLGLKMCATISSKVFSFF
jgi:hypothetical protein